MSDYAADIGALTRDLVSIDSRSFVSNIPIAEHLEQVLSGFELERLDFTDKNGVAKRVLVAHRGGAGGIAFSGHMDTVPDTGWQEDPWSARVDEEGHLHGLGSTDMKGPVAAFITAAKALPSSIPVTLLLTTDEETTKEGARQMARRSELVRRVGVTSIVITEPTRLQAVRGHRSHIEFTAVARGEQAHSSTGKGWNANWTLLPFLTDMRGVFDRLRSDTTLQDSAYDPPFSDFNLVLDNHGTAINVTVPVATARIKYRFSARIDPESTIAAVQDAANRHGVELTLTREGPPPELPEDHPFVRLCESVTGIPAGTAPYGTDANELQAIAPCVVLGPGDIGQAHTRTEKVRLADLVDAVPVFLKLAERVAAA